VLSNPSEWVAACGDPLIVRDYKRLDRLVSAVEPLFHRALVRQRQLLQDKPEAQIIKAAEVAMALTPGCAAGRPLRALSVCGSDSKFFELAGIEQQGNGCVVLEAQIPLILRFQ
jgi:hypothetical protein